MTVARELARRPLTYLLATVAALAAAFRVARSQRQGGFDETVERLRQGRPFAGRLSDPIVHLRVVGRLLPLLPPRRMGSCLKRSLILLHLWSRCGLEPRLHLGFRKDVGDAWQGHAWLTADRAGAPLAAGFADGHAEAFVFGTPE